MTKSSKCFRAACVQMSAGSDAARNLKKSLALSERALQNRPDIVALPENFYWRGPKQALARLAAEATPAALDAFSALARKSRTAFLLGSIIEPSRDKRRFYNTSVLIASSGKIQTRYRKIHLFDVTLPQGVSICESETCCAGKTAVTALIRGRRAGFAVCYDLRFPELFRQLMHAGSRMIFLPANFTRETGQAHWETLIRARAIENQVFMIAPAQTGTHPVTGVASYGNSLIVDPWGQVLARGSLSREEVVWADLDWGIQDRLRRRFPVLQHIRLA